MDGVESISEHACSYVRGAPQGRPEAGKRASVRRAYGGSGDRPIDRDPFGFLSHFGDLGHDYSTLLRGIGLNAFTKEGSHR